MATIGGAKVFHADALIGSLESGKLADIAIFAAAAGEHHAAVVDASDTDVALVFRAGEVLYGERDVVTALDPDCDALDACERELAICARREFGGTSYDTIANEVNGAYAAMFCEVPADEPSCVPMRDAFTGVPTDADLDGDGIANDADNCPTVFNPIRPMDEGKQPDTDGDGSGDPCDVSPVGTDLDGDMVSNAEDNCPFDENQAQDDGDADAKGDACDACASYANPDTACPAVTEFVETTIAAIQRGEHAAKSGVAVRESSVGSNPTLPVVTASSSPPLVSDHVRDCPWSPANPAPWYW